MSRAEIRYPEYRAYSRNRIQVNNAMMALLAGARLAAHTLQLTTGSDRTLREVFPAVEHIGRFNLKSDEARALLADADGYVAAVAIPYALATHEAYVMSAIEMLRRAGTPIETGGNAIRPWNMHEVIFNSTGHQASDVYVQVFHLIREMRNCVIHVGAGVSQRVIDCLDGMTDPAADLWRRLNDQEPSEIIAGSQVQLIAEHVFTAFASTKWLGREINSALARALSSSDWANIAVQDFHDHTAKVRNSSSWRRGVLGYVRLNYGPLAMREAEIEAAARHLGLWTISRWK